MIFFFFFSFIFDFCSFSFVLVPALIDESPVPLTINLHVLSSDPLVTLDVWRTIKQLFDPNSRQVKLLWTPVNLFLFSSEYCRDKPQVQFFSSYVTAFCSQRVSGSAATVNIQRYIIKWSQGDKNWTEWKDGAETQADVFIGSGRCDFTLTPVVRSGSTVSAHITIPQRDDGGE